MGDAQPERFDGFGLWRWRDGCVIERDAREGKFLALGTVGEDAIVTDAHEAGRQDVQEEAADELGGFERHHAAPVAVSVVLVTKAHRIVGETDEPVIGDGDAMGVAAEIVEHLRGAGEGTLGVDHPVGFVQGIEQTALLAWLAECCAGSSKFQRATVKQAREAGDELATKDLGERFDREEKPASRGDPVAVGGECAGGHQAMQVQVLGERLAPGVQHEGSGDVAAEPARVGAELGELVRNTLEEQRIECARIALRERVLYMRQGEDEMEVRHRQEFGAPGGEPAFLGPCLALRAVAVAAGVVVVAKFCTRVTALDMATECVGATRLDCAHRSILHGSQCVCGLIRRAKAREELRQFYRVSCRIRCLRMRAHGALAARRRGRLQ